MPTRTKYRCLNPSCDTIFVAMNSPLPECPKCKCVKLHEWGEAENYLSIGILTRPSGAPYIGKGSVKRIDNTLRGLADSYGLTDIKNNNGRAAKQYEPETTGKYGNLNIAGVSCPIGDRPSTHSGATPYTPFSVETTGRLPGNRNVPTQVVMEHKGNQ